jgi:hypothetical protein
MQRLLLAMWATVCVGGLAVGAEGEVKAPKPDAPKAAAEKPAQPKPDAPEAENPEARIKQALEKRITFDFVDTPFRDTLAFLQNLLNVNVVVDPGFDAATTVTLKVNDMKAANALEWIVKLAGATMEIRNEAIFIQPVKEEPAEGLKGLLDGKPFRIEIEAVIRLRPEKPGEQADVHEEDLAAARIRKVLADKAITVEFNETPLKDVMAALQDKLGVPIVLEPGVPKDALVTLHGAKNMTGIQVLQWVGKLVGAKPDIRRGTVVLRPVEEHGRLEKAHPKPMKPERPLKPGEPAERPPEPEQPAKDAKGGQL